MCARGTGHAMVYQSGAYSTWICDTCRARSTQYMRWHCRDHKSDLCHTCYAKKQDALCLKLTPSGGGGGIGSNYVPLPRTEAELSALTIAKLKDILKAQHRDSSLCGK
jgi:hypothetical protein